jgi:uncharacterized membrane protein YqiK
VDRILPLLHHAWPIVAGLVALVNYKFILKLLGVYIIPNNKIGLVVKKFALFGKNRQLPPGRIVALKGEAGIQADTLAPGLHVGLWPWQYAIELCNMLVVPPGQMALVESKDGDPLPDGRVVAQHVVCDNFQDARAFLENGGQRGVQAGVIPPGTWRVNALVFKPSIVEMTVLEEGEVGVVEALDGKPLSGGRVLARTVECDSFQDPRAFMENGGERGPQMAIIPQGQYRINPALFQVTRARVVDIAEGKVGIVTTREGKPLPSGEIAGPEVGDHSMFQDPQSFVEAGGFKGLQEQVLLAGRYFLNPRFVSVEMVDMTEVPIAHVGVVVSYVGKEGTDVTGETFKHANLVGEGERGVWAVVLDPGKYPINPRTHKVIPVPTANVVLNWATGKSEAHKLDANLSTITVRSSDGFTFNLDVSQLIHIPRNDAPRVIARFGSMEALVTQVLEPTIGNYFRNAAQNHDVIEFLKNRSARQEEAKMAITAALAANDVGAVETLIGDIVPPAELMRTLTDRKLAEQERQTYETQRMAQIERKELQEATAQADTQAGVVTAKRSVEISDFEAQAHVKKASGDAQAKTINAEADAKVLTTVGLAEADKILAVGTSQAKVIRLQTEAVGQDNYRTIESVRALASAGLPLVPQIVAGSGGAQGGYGSLIDVLIAGLVRDAQKRAPSPLDGAGKVLPAQS